MNTINYSNNQKFQTKKSAEVPNSFHQKTASSADLVSLTRLLIDKTDNLKSNISKKPNIVNLSNWTWTCRESNPVDVGYQPCPANLPSPRQNKYSTII